jgi:hypothetical protein
MDKRGFNFCNFQKYVSYALKEDITNNLKRKCDEFSEDKSDDQAKYKKIKE